MHACLAERMSSNHNSSSSICCVGLPFNSFMTSESNSLCKTTQVFLNLTLLSLIKRPTRPCVSLHKQRGRPQPKAPHRERERRREERDRKFAIYFEGWGEKEDKERGRRKRKWGWGRKNYDIHWFAGFERVSSKSITCKWRQLRTELRPPWHLQGCQPRFRSSFSMTLYLVPCHGCAGPSCEWHRVTTVSAPPHWMDLVFLRQ